MAKQEMVVTVRLTREEANKLDGFTVGQFSRSQVVRIILQDFLEQDEKNGCGF